MTINELFKIITERQKSLPKDSYSAALFKKGLDKIIQKVGEESVETLIAAKNNSKQQLIKETADLLYHLLALLVEKKITLEEIEDELEKRHKKG